MRYQVFSRDLVIASTSEAILFRRQYLHQSIFVLLPKKRKQMDTKKVGKRIKLARIELYLTQTQLAQKINSKQKSISHYETGVSLPSIRTLVKIVKVLKKPASYFLDE